MKKVQVIPLGGLEEIGKNMTVIRYEDEIYVVDAGLAFPDAEMYGVGVVIPDFDYLRKNKEKIKAMIVTHAHEDHIGALPHFLKEFDVPLYTSKLTAGLLREKLKGTKVGMRQLNIVNAESELKLGECTISFFRTIHSIPDSLGVVIETPIGRIVHTGDFRIDYAPLDGHYFDFHRVSELGKKGVLCLLSDSTNATKEGVTMSEKRVRRSLEQIIDNAKGRVILATFSSSLYRVQNIFDIAEKLGKKLFVAGRRMENNIKICTKLGYLTYDERTMITHHELSEYRDDELIILTTGAQGESLAGLSKMANGQHKFVSLKEGDTVILSSSPIKGNEKAINTLGNNLVKRGIDIIEKGEIHTSGHGNQEEQKLMLSLLRPKFFIPVHGEYRMLKAHGESAIEVGIPKENIVYCENGNVIEIEENSIKKAGSVQADSVLVDDSGLGDVDAFMIRDRKRLATQGVAVVQARFTNEQNGKDRIIVKCVMKGIVGKYNKVLLHKELRDVIVEVNESKEKRDIYIELSNIIYKHLKKKPLMIYMPVRD